MLQNYFDEREKLLVIEGAAASGKTSLMRRIAFDWANGNEKLQYDLVLISEFRNLKYTNYNTIVDCVLCGMDTVLSAKNSKFLQESLTEEYCQNHDLLILLDGYDEAFPKDQCTELYNHVVKSNEPTMELVADIVLSTRPGHVPTMGGRFGLAYVLGFDTDAKKKRYLDAHFKIDEEEQKNLVFKILSTNSSLNKLAETPLFLAFICLVHQDLETGSLFDLYYWIICFLIDRYQKDHPKCDVPALFRNPTHAPQENDCEVKHTTIKRHFCTFPLIRELGKFAFFKYDILTFSDSDLNEYQLEKDVKTILEPVGLLIAEKKKENSHTFIFEYVFPHRTIQEFLAGGVYYLWPELESEKFDLLTSAFKKAFPDDLQTIPTKLLKMSDLELFIWKIALNPKHDLDSRTYSFFKNYETLWLDLFLLDDGTNNTARNLNAYLKRCCNVTKLFFHSSEEVFLNHPLDFTSMISLKYVVFFSKESISKNIHFNAFTSDMTATSCILVNSDNKIKKISFVGSIFKSIECVVATVEHLKQRGDIETISSATLQFSESMFTFDQISGHAIKTFFMDTTNETKLSTFKLRHGEVPLELSTVKFYFGTIKIYENRDEIDQINKIRRHAEYSVLKMEELFAYWWGTASHSQIRETVCIPPATFTSSKYPMKTVDPMASGYSEKFNARNCFEMKVKDAENSFRSHFQALKIGGILISNFELATFCKFLKIKMRYYGFSEIDFIFLHPSIGIVIFGMKVTVNINQKKIRQALNQIRKTKERFGAVLFKMLNEENFDWPIHTMVCFPNVEDDSLESSYECSFIGSNLLNDTERLRNKILNKRMPQELNELSSKALKRFASAIACCNPLDGISIFDNALALHDIIDRQLFCVRKDGIASGSSLGIRFNPDQLGLLEIRDKNLFIWGPPGTGIIQVILQKILNEAKVKKPGNLRLITSSKSLCTKFMNLYEIHEEFMNYRPQIDCKLTARDEDDVYVFIDEEKLNSATDTFLKRRKRATGITLVVFQYPIRLRKYRPLVEQGYFYYEMSTVTRCTGKIFAEWRDAFTKSDYRLCLDHSIDGQAVQEKKAVNAEEVFRFLFASISPCFNSESNVRPRHLCIITEDNSDSRAITKYLSALNITCGSLEEQMKDPNKIAVTPFKETPLFEWPVVFVVTFHILDRYGPFHVIAASRATARLVIIECPLLQKSIWSRFWPFRKN